MAQALTGRICNLTEMADHMRLDEAARIRVLETATSCVELLNSMDISQMQPCATMGETFYLIVAGDGIIEESDGGTIIVTAGDVVFVPAHLPHRFIQQSRKFRTWKIDLAQGGEGKGKPLPVTSVSDQSLPYT